ncbi:hypothetical protein EVAR_58082_1 [Eumeta japonica]|uniref:Uncharacterized protein n=1 Tax=Eumeta variegata TaxID=151549 RepID=A0A4C1ZG01_EUMVA|nr:hypothetical protein EVAR_58082_1 [Eumeta japonica]
MRRITLTRNVNDKLRRLIGGFGAGFRGRRLSHVTRARCRRNKAVLKCSAAPSKRRFARAECAPSSFILNDPLALSSGLATFLGLGPTLSSDPGAGSRFYSPHRFQSRYHCRLRFPFNGNRSGDDVEGDNGTETVTESRIDISIISEIGGYKKRSDPFFVQPNVGGEESVVMEKGVDHQNFHSRDEKKLHKLLLHVRILREFAISPVELACFRASAKLATAWLY